MRKELYGQLPALMRRLFTLGLGCAVLFLTAWYLGGYNLWGHFLDVCLNVTAPFFNLSFQPGDSDSASFWHKVTLGGTATELEFKINLLSAHMVEVVTLLAIWPYTNLKQFLRLAAWCLLFTVLYQTFNIVIQTYVIEIGPKLANRLEIFYEETLWFRFIKKVASFDMFILRYWAGFPIFLFALLANNLIGPKTESGKARQKK